MKQFNIDFNINDEHFYDYDDDENGEFEFDFKKYENNYNDMKKKIFDNFHKNKNQ